MQYENLQIFSLDMHNIMKEKMKALTTRHHFSCHEPRYDFGIVDLTSLIPIFSPNIVD